MHRIKKKPAHREATAGVKGYIIKKGVKGYYSPRTLKNDDTNITVGLQIVIILELLLRRRRPADLLLHRKLREQQQYCVVNG